MHSPPTQLLPSCAQGIVDVDEQNPESPQVE